MMYDGCIFVPATSANLGPGFDAIGMALGIYNELTLREGEDTSLSVTGEGAGEVHPTDNLIVRAYRSAFEYLGEKPIPLLMSAHNRIPFSRGLGSSSAAIVAGLAAAQIASRQALSTDALVYLATKMDGHPDNVLPALLGGVVVGADVEDRVVYHRMTPPQDLMATVLIPEYPLPTKKAREALPIHYSKKDAVFNIGRMGLLVAAMMSGEVSLLRDAMNDRLHEPYRLPLMPGIEAARTAALEAGALAAVVSGAGSTMLVLSNRALEPGVLLEPLRAAGHDGAVFTPPLVSNGATYLTNEMELKICP